MRHASPGLDALVQEQLLGRAVCDVLSDDDRGRLRGQRVLITGGGGSVGSELARQLASAGVGRLTLMDHSEYALFQIDHEIREAYPKVRLVTALGDISRHSDMRAACGAAEPHVVYHAAAYKHVTFAETAIVQALRVNALGALEAARTARATGARFVLISSDKAAEPRSVMGATKRFAEHLVLGEATEGFRPLVVRFGNILGSSGSVAEIDAQTSRSGAAPAGDGSRGDALLHDGVGGGLSRAQGGSHRRSDPRSSGWTWATPSAWAISRRELRPTSWRRAARRSASRRLGSVRARSCTRS